MLNSMSSRRATAGVAVWQLPQKNLTFINRLISYVVKICFVLFLRRHQLPCLFWKPPLKTADKTKMYFLIWKIKLSFVIIQLRLWTVLFWYITIMWRILESQCGCFTCISVRFTHCCQTLKVYIIKTDYIYFDSTLLFLWWTIYPCKSIHK